MHVISYVQDRKLGEEEMGSQRREKVHPKKSFLGYFKCTKLTLKDNI